MVDVEKQKRELLKIELTSLHFILNSDYGLNKYSDITITELLNRYKEVKEELSGI